jgi:hypothetical protein
MSKAQCVALLEFRVPQARENAGMLVLKPRGEIVANRIRSSPRRRREVLVDRKEDSLTEGA